MFTVQHITRINALPLYKMDDPSLFFLTIRTEMSLLNRNYGVYYIKKWLQYRLHVCNNFVVDPDLCLASVYCISLLKFDKILKYMYINVGKSHCREVTFVWHFKFKIDKISLDVWYFTVYSNVFQPVH